MDSVLAQSFRNFEVVCVDDGSTDSSSAILDAYAAKDARIRVIHRKNGGGSASRNTGLNAAKGRYIAFMDNDDLYHPDCLKLLLSGFQKYPKAWICTGTVQGFNDGTEIVFPETKKIKRTVYSRPFFAKFLFKRHIPMFMWLKLYRRECFADIRFDEKLPSSKDSLLFLEMLLLDKPFACTHFPVYAYRMHPDQQSRKVFDEKTEVPHFVRAVSRLAQKSGGIKRFVLERIAAKAVHTELLKRLNNPTEEQRRLRKRILTELLAEKAFDLSRLSRRRRQEILKIVAE